MNLLTTYALQHAAVEPAHLINAINQIEPDQQDRFVELVLGLVNLDDVVNDIPTTAVYNDKVCTFEGYHHLTEKVDYSYPDSDTRYFETQEDADRWVAGKYYKGSSSYSESEKYPFRAVKNYTSHSSMSLSSWCDYANRGQE